MGAAKTAGMCRLLWAFARRLFGVINTEISLFIFFMIFPIFYNIFINIHEYPNYANTVDHGMKGLCLSFNLVPILVVCGKQQLRYD